MGVVVYLGVEHTHHPCDCRHHTLECHRYHVKHTCKQCKLDCLKSESPTRRHQRDVNLCGACARPKGERSLVRGRGGLLPADMLERWPHVCRIKITLGLLPTNRFVCTKNEFDEI